jgi:hypothetical protein
MENPLSFPAASRGARGTRGQPLPWHLAEARLAISARVNLLLIGPEQSVGQLLDTLHPELIVPVVNWRLGTPLTLPAAGLVGTLILRDLQRMSAHEQRRLLDWLPAAVRHVQVVSTVPAPLLPLLQTGAFLDALYYRLNTVCVDATP